MDQQQTQQTEQIIAEMLEFLETSSEDEHDLEPQTKVAGNEADNSIKKDLNQQIVNENIKTNTKTKKELQKLRNLDYFAEIVLESNPETKNSTIVKTELETGFSSNFDWQFKLENHCRRSYNNTYTQEVYKAIYQNTNGHPRSGSADYYQAAQNYVLHGNHFLDFPKSMQVLLNDKICQNSVADNSSLITNFSNCLYSKPNITTPTITIPGNSCPSTAASTAAYYQILNNMQAQTRLALAANPSNSAAYGIFMGNKVTYVAGTATTPSLIYNQHNTTTTNFIANSLANAALATSPAILYTNPLLTTTTQQYLTQFLSAAALTANSVQSTTVSANVGGGSIYERLIYAQMLQQQLYQTQQAASISAMFQTKHRAVNAAARPTANVMNTNSNRSSPQHTAAAPLSSSSNGINFNSCYRQARSTSPGGLKLQTSMVIAPTEVSEHSKISNA